MLPGSCWWCWCVYLSTKNVAILSQRLKMPLATSNEVCCQLEETHALSRQNYFFSCHSARCSLMSKCSHLYSDIQICKTGSTIYLKRLVDDKLSFQPYIDDFAIWRCLLEQYSLSSDRCNLCKILKSDKLLRYNSSPWICYIIASGLLKAGGCQQLPT